MELIPPWVMAVIIVSLVINILFQMVGGYFIWSHEDETFREYWASIGSTARKQLAGE